MDLIVSSGATVGISVGPFERLGAFVVNFDIASDFAGEVGFGSKDAAGDQIALNFGEPDFDLIEPGRVGRCVMELNVGMGGEELRHGLSFVRRKVVGDDVDLLALGLCGDDICEKGNELRTSVAQDWLRLTAAKVCPPAKPRLIRTRRTSSARRLWLRLMRFNSRRSGGLNLKGAGMKKIIPQYRQM